MRGGEGRDGTSTTKADMTSNTNEMKLVGTLEKAAETLALMANVVTGNTILKGELSLYC